MQVEKYSIASKYGARVLILKTEQGTKMFHVETAHAFIVHECFEGNDPFEISFTPDEQEESLRGLISMLTCDSLEVMSKLYNDEIEMPVYQKAIAKLLSFSASKEKTIHKSMRKYAAVTFQLKFDGNVFGYLVTEPNAPLIEGGMYHFEMSMYSNKVYIKNIRQYKNSYSSLQKAAA